MDTAVDIIVVSHTHWDREWYKSFEEFRFSLVQALDELIDAMEADEGYTHFLLDGQTIVIEDYLELRPERRERFERLARSGRISLGPWYLQPDEQLVSGESLIRNLMIGHRMAGEFGEVMKEGYVPDTFGHIAQLPQLLAGFDIPSFYSMRGTAEELAETGSEVYWQAPDGSSVWSHHLLSYSNAAILAPTPETMRLHHGTNINYDSLDELKGLLLAWATSPTLLLMNGNDHLRPQPDAPGLVRSLDAHSNDRIRLGSLSDFRLACLAKKRELAVVSGERTSGRYQKILQGVLSTRISLKQRNSEIENRLSRIVEPLWASLWSAGAAYPARMIEAAWKELIRNHPHDSICGCSIDRVHRDMVYRFDQAADRAELLIAEGLEQLAARVEAEFDESQDELALVVFNPSQYERSGVVEVAVDPYIGYPYGKREFAPSGYRPIELGSYVTDQGYPVIVDGEEFVSEDVLNRRKHVMKKRLRLRVDGVPALGHATVVLRPATEAAQAAAAPTGDASPLTAAGRTIENEHLTVTAEEDGSLTLLHKESGIVLRGLNLFEDEADRGDEYTFCGTAEAPVRSTGAPCEVELVDRAPVEVALRVRFSLSVPLALSEDRSRRVPERVELPIETTVRLAPGARFAAITTLIENRARDHRLRVVFPAGFPATTSIAESAFCTVERPVEGPSGDGWTEQPCSTHAQQRYAALGDGSRGIALFNRGLPEFEATAAGELKLTLLRSVGWLSRPDLDTRPGNAGPEIATPEAQCPGPQRFEYAICPYSGPFAASGLWQEADKFIQPLLAARVRSSDRSLPAARSLLRVEGDRLVLTALKRSESGEGLIVRLFNTGADAVEGLIESSLPLSRAVLTNLNEEDRDELAVEGSRRVEVRCPGYRILTLRLLPAVG